MNLKTIALLAALVGGVLISGAHAQSFVGQIPSGNVYGNETGGAAKPHGTPLTSLMLDKGFGTTRGSFMERGASGWGLLAPGTSGLPFVSNGAGADPAYQTLGIPGGGTGATTAGAALQNLGAYANQFTAISGGSITASSVLGKVIGDNSTGQSNTLPAASTATGFALIFQHQQGGIWTLTRSGSDNIFGPNGWDVTSWSLVNLGDTVVLFSDGTNWHVIGLGGGYASTAQYLAGTAATNAVTPSVIYQAETTTTYGSTTSFDFSTFINTAVTLTGNITTMNVSNVKAGQAGTITFIQDGTGSRTTVFNSIFKFVGGAAPALSSTANAIDVLAYSCRSATFCVASMLNNVH